MPDRGNTQSPALTHLAVAGYRSLQQLTLPLGGLTLVCGANGCGKSNLYRSLGLIAAAARGDLVAALAAEGGLPAVFWAGPERTTREMRRSEQPVQGSSGRRQAARLRLGIACETLSYAIELGYRADDQTSAFVLDPEIKREWIWAGGPFHPRSLLVQRTGAVVERCGEGGPSRPLALEVSPHESLFTAVSDPLEAPEVFQLRNTILSWRFYDSFRTDRQAPARSGRIATRTPSLAGDGGDLAAAVQTHPSVGGGPRRGSDHGSGGHPRLPAAAIGAGARGHGAARPDGAGAGRLALAGVKDGADISADIPTVDTSPLALHRIGSCDRLVSVVHGHEGDTALLVEHVSERSLGQALFSDVLGATDHKAQCCRSRRLANQVLKIGHRWPQNQPATRVAAAASTGGCASFDNEFIGAVAIIPAEDPLGSFVLKQHIGGVGKVVFDPQVLAVGTRESKDLAVVELHHKGLSALTCLFLNCAIVIVNNLTILAETTLGIRFRYRLSLSGNGQGYQARKGQGRGD